MKRGSLFFSFPAVPFTLENGEGLKYCYISFMGAGIPSLLASLGVSLDCPVYHGFEHLAPFWLEAAVRVHEENADLISQGVLMYTLSFLRKPGEYGSREEQSEKLIRAIVDYVDENYRFSGLSLKMLSEVFSYTEKYLSRIFKVKMGVGFSQYLNNLRIQYALECMQKGNCSVGEVSAACGYSDAGYFSRTFKKRTGFSPVEYQRRKVENRKKGDGKC